MPAVRWEPIHDGIRFHFIRLERYKMKLELSDIDKFLKCCNVDFMQAGCTLLMVIVPMYQLRKSICRDLFLKRHAVLYPAPRLYPGGAFDPFWEDNEALFPDSDSGGYTFSVLYMQWNSTTNRLHALEGGYSKGILLICV